MNETKKPTINYDPWRNLNQFTTARIGLGRAGMSLTTSAYLDFQFAHAQARDAVHIPLDFNRLAQNINLLGYQTLLLQSLAKNQAMYLQRPDLGRQLKESSHEDLKHNITTEIDVAIIVADGLSSKAIEHHAEKFLGLLLPKLKASDYKLSPICLIKHARVAIGDAVAECCAARLCIVLIGERPGLSSPDSMGIYFTYQAKADLSTDVDRNCISNVHTNGLSYEQALIKLLYLVQESEKLHYSGVNLKDETSDSELNIQQGNFLLY